MLEIGELKRSLATLRESKFGVTDRSISEHQYLIGLLQTRNEQRPYSELRRFATDNYDDLRLKPAIFGLGLCRLTENEFRSQRIAKGRAELSCSLRTFQRQEAESCEELAYDIYHFYNDHTEEEVAGEYLDRTSEATIGDLYRKLDVVISVQSELKRDLTEIRRLSIGLVGLKREVNDLKSTLDELTDNQFELAKMIIDSNDNPQ